MRPVDEIRFAELRDRLQAYSSLVTPLPGIARADALDSLVRQMIDSLHRIEFVQRLGQRLIDPRRKDPQSALFDPVRAAWLYHEEGDSDEAAWLIFLSTHFGFHKRVGWELRWRRKFGQLAKVGSTSMKDGLYDWEAEAVHG